jgi:hypothetical protein
MGWEWRKGKPYYYRKVRDGKRVRSEYIGPPGDRARLFMSLDQLDRARRQQEAAEKQQARQALAELIADPPELVELVEQARAAVAAALEAAGYHQHKRGEWRKKRAQKADETR